MIDWIAGQNNFEPILQNDIHLGSHYKVVPTEGYIAWEYNPLRNYRLTSKMFEKDGKYYTVEEVTDYLKSINENFSFYKDPLLPYSDEEIEANFPDCYEEYCKYSLREEGELVDFITSELSFDLQHPVEILPQYSYDGSVNLILNDGLNIPRLINSRFTVTGRNTYKVIDRKGDSDTNIYDQGSEFDTDTSLFKNVNKIPTLKYLGTNPSGNVKIGNYHFYFKYSDADGNETDWVAESGLVSVFIGNSVESYDTGIRDENSLKSIKFSLGNIDIGYSYVKVYYTRYSADVNGNYVVSAKRIDKNFIINDTWCNIIITGDEDETEVTLAEINSSFDIIQNAQTQCSAANRLFMANIHKYKIEYDKLSKLSLCFCPYQKQEDYPLINGIDEEYNWNVNSEGYYDDKYIYDKTGYWPSELYRLGVVYILKDGSLSPVFNIRGAVNIPQEYTLTQEDGSVPTLYYKVEKDFEEQGDSEDALKNVLEKIDYNEDNFLINNGSAEYENAKGIVSFKDDGSNVFPVVGINITANHLVIEELKKYCKGFFFVRQKRMPLTLCQGVVIGLDKESRTPTIPILGGVLGEVDYNNTYIETSDINYINYVSEGFVSHYKYKYEAKSADTGKKILMGSGIVVLLALTAVATVFTCGAAGVAVGTGLAAAISAGAVAVGGALGTIGIVTGAVVGVTAVAYRIENRVINRRQKLNQDEVLALKGRYAEIPEGYERVEEDTSRQLERDFIKRIIIKEPKYNEPGAIIAPDYQVNQPYYNQFLTGDKFVLKSTYEQSFTNYLNVGFIEGRSSNFYFNNYHLTEPNPACEVNLVGVPDGCPVKVIGDSIFRARAGYPEEAYKYEFQGVKYEDNVNIKENSDIIRGNFGSYIGVKGYEGHAGEQVNIMIPGYNDTKILDYMQLRMSDNSAFYAISDRIDINTIYTEEEFLDEETTTFTNFSKVFFRGDCYICRYSHRIIRNFNDPSAPYNDEIIDKNTWRENYDPENIEKYANINLGDVNAVPLGMWFTFWLRSSYNLNIRTVDKSNVDEYLMSGNYRSFYPHYGLNAKGTLKLPDSDQYNKGFTKSVSEKYYFEVPDVPYIKQEFQNRIVFSDIHINDAFKNGFRVLRNMNYKDYPMTYGSITKILEVKNTLFVVFEHGIGLIGIDNTAEQSYMVLSELEVISDTYGSQWKDSIIKTDNGIYGVDTIAKKIWRYSGGELQLISDFKVQEFLNQNISLSERELTPILGIRNVKTVYNAFKHDVMFTFYDNLYGTHEKSWNLCFNETLNIFTTFYSWIPSDMQNIDNIPFSFNRDTVKAIAKIGVSDHGNDFSDGITLSNNVLNVIGQKQDVDENGHVIYTPPTFEVADKTLKVQYLDKQGAYKDYEFLTVEPYPQIGDCELLSEVINQDGFIGFLHLDNRMLPDDKMNYHIEYQLLHDRWRNYDLFEIKPAKLYVKQVNTKFKSEVQYIEVYYLTLKKDVYATELLSEIYYRNEKGISYPDYDVNKLPPGEIPYVYNNLKIEGTRIINKSKLLQLIDEYGLDWPTGFDTSLESDTATHCGYLKDIDIDNIEDISGVDEESQYHGILLSEHWLLEAQSKPLIYTNLPIFKNKQGKRLMLPKELQINPDKIIRYLNIKAKVILEPIIEGWEGSELDALINGGTLIEAGYFESQVAITTSFNLSLLSTDFWKHGQAGIIDITDKIYPTYWYGQQHPFEFEFVVVEDPSVHKIFNNLEIISNKAKPESFHYEVVGDVYDFADDKPTMYFRQEALKALYQFNGYDIEYNANFLDIDPKQHNRSADFPKYYSRWDSVNEIYDSYKRFSAPLGFNYDHLAGAEIVYYPTRNEFRVWNHAEAIDLDSLDQELATSIIKANCRYLEDKWLVTINPIVVTYKNEINKSLVEPGNSMFTKDAYGVYKYSSWVKGTNDNKLPPINIQGTKLYEKFNGDIKFPKDGVGMDNALYGLYDLTEWNKGSWKPIDPTRNKDRCETDVRGKFIKIRIRYSGEDLVILDFLNTIYQTSYA